MRDSGILRWIGTGLVFLFLISSVHGESHKAPSFFISSLENKRFVSREIKDPVVLSFFFVDCLPCRKEMPELYRFISLKQPHARLLFINPLASDTDLRIRKLADLLGIPQSRLYHDVLGVIAGKFKVDNRFPTIIGIRKGQIIFRLHDMSARSLRLMTEKLN